MRFDDNRLTEKVHGFPRRLNAAVDEVFDADAAYGTAWMKTNAPWRDDTGAARASLAAMPARRGRTHEMLLTHGVHYGIWLETKYNRRDQIIASAQRVIGNKIMADMLEAFRQANQ